ncbi:MAG TPA: ABC transporter ATP-binding protein [Blastocatellia bacterium]|nr:ABC transporter ATP-binding protein [Blastocatellia bacterium]
MTNNTPVVRLRSVSRTYRNGAVAITAVRDVSFDIHQGERLAIMGPSGSGKSTLMNMIGLLDRPSKGAILLEGTDVSSLSDDKKSRLRTQKIGFIFQAYNLLARYTAIENVALPLIYSGVGRRERLRRSEQALDMVGVAHRARHFPSELSGGEQQRVAIARALVGSPAIMLADEPTGALDSRSGAEILSLFSELNRAGQTLVMITHDAGIAAQCQRAVRLQDGGIVADQTHLAAFPRRAVVA